MRSACGGAPAACSWHTQRSDNVGPDPFPEPRSRPPVVFVLFSSLRHRCPWPLNPTAALGPTYPTLAPQALAASLLADPAAQQRLASSLLPQLGFDVTLLRSFEVASAAAVPEVAVSNASGTFVTTPAQVGGWVGRGAAMGRARQRGGLRPWADAV